MVLALEFGDFKLSVISGGRFRLDGGAMFGIVPKPLWETVAPPDELNRIRLNTNCLLVQTKGKNVLVDTGIGSRLPSKQLEQIDGETGNQLFENLQKANLNPGQIDMVIFSHLHFDHASGAFVESANGSLQLAFPNAIHVVQRTEWNDAIAGHSWLKGNYSTDELKLLERAKELRLIGGRNELMPGLFVDRTGGHTDGHQLIELKFQNERALYLGDICPTAGHLKSFWTLAYDINQGETRREKEKILPAIAKENGVLFFDHDPDHRAVRLALNEKNRVVISENIDVPYFGSA